MPEIKIHVMQHKKTGLLAAMSEDLKGFMVHAHTEEEMFAKLGPAFEHFMKAIGEPISDVSVRQESPEGFWPPTYVATGRLEKEAA
jgi:hypothetical protein